MRICRAQHMRTYVTAKIMLSRELFVRRYRIGARTVDGIAIEASAAETSSLSECA